MKKTLSGLALLGLLLLAGSCSSVPTFLPTDLSPSLNVTDKGAWIVVTAQNKEEKKTGVVFYPGGFVKPEAYVPLVARWAQAGYPVVIVKMPFDLAFFDAEKGLQVPKTLPAVEHWVLAGHSLGGVAAAIAIDKNPGVFSGIVFLASYPAKDNDLSALILPALSISASNDGLSTQEKVDAAAAFLPVGTERVVIEGGNHAQFADYGPQRGDGVATLSREAQQSQVAQSVTAFLDQF